MTLRTPTPMLCGGMLALVLTGVVVQAAQPTTAPPITNDANATKKMPAGGGAPVTLGSGISTPTTKAAPKQVDLEAGKLKQNPKY